MDKSKTKSHSDFIVIYLLEKKTKNFQTSRSTKAKYAVIGVLIKMTVKFTQTCKPNITHNDNKNNTNINIKNEEYIKFMESTQNRKIRTQTNLQALPYV